MNEYNYNDLRPFKWFILQNFPFIEADFDALTNYELMCKLAEKMNEVINSINNVGNEVELLSNAFINLKSYVDNYFADLNVQDEINNKLDDMAESGQLTDIIAQYLQLAGLLCYNTVSDMANATNIVDGSFARTFGRTTYNDGYGAFYKIRDMINTDIVDGENIVAITHDNQLVAEKMPCYLDGEITTINNSITSINNRHTLEDSKKSIFIGDSYLEGYSPDGNIATEDNFVTQFCNMAGITEYQRFYLGGIGFYQERQDTNFLKLLQQNIDNITNKNMVKNIFVFGGYNDAYTNPSITDVSTKIAEFVTYCKTQFPNATVYVGEIGFDVRLTSAGSDRRYYLSTKIVPAYSQTVAVKPSYVYLSNLDRVLHDKTLMASDGYHPNTLGHTRLANAIYNSYMNSNNDDITDFEYFSYSKHSNFPNSSVSGNVYIQKSLKGITLHNASNFHISFSNEYPTISNSFTAICRFDNSNLLLPTYNQKFQTNVVIKDRSNNYYSCHGIVNFTGEGTIELAVKEIRDGWFTQSNIEYIEFADFNIFADTYIL